MEQEIISSAEAWLQCFFLLWKLVLIFMLVAFTEKCVCLPFRARTPCHHPLMRMLQESVVTFPSNLPCYWIECWIEVSTRSLVSEHKRALVSFLLVCLVSHGQLRNKTMFACLSFWKQKFRSLTIPRYTFSFESYCRLPSRRMLLCRSPILKSNFGLGTEGRLVLCSVFLGGGEQKKSVPSIWQSVMLPPPSHSDYKILSEKWRILLLNNCYPLDYASSVL